MMREELSDVFDEEWWFVLPYPLLCCEDVAQRKNEGERCSMLCAMWLARAVRVFR